MAQHTEFKGLRLKVGREAGGLGLNPQIAAGKAGKRLAINHLTVREISYVEGVLTTDSHVCSNDA